MFPVTVVAAPLNKTLGIRMMTERPTNADTIQESSPRALWVLEGRLDIPVFFANQDIASTRAVTGLFLDFSGRTGDGVIELRVEQTDKINQSVWWSRDEPVAFAFRASVIASSMPEAWLRSYDFLEQMLDRLTLLTGTPARLLEAGVLYNESELEDCRHGRRAEFGCTTHGVPTRKTTPFANMHIIDRLRPSERAQRALRWLRKGLSYENVEDRFLAFYFALECISNDIKETAEKTHTCRSCGKSTGIAKAQTDGIKALIQRHPEARASLFAGLGKARAKLVHGGDPKARQMAGLLEPVARTLAMEGIALSLGVDPTSLRMTDAATVDLFPILVGTYEAGSDPATKWGRSMTAFIEELKGMDNVNA